MADRTARREAVGELGAALRDLVDAAVRTEVSIPELAAATEVARELADRLRKDSRALHEVASVDDPQVGERWYSPVYGPGEHVVEQRRHDAPVHQPRRPLVRFAQGDPALRAAVGAAAPGPLEGSTLQT